MFDSFLSQYIIPVDTPYPNYYVQQKALTTAKKQFLHLKDVQSQVLQEAVKRVDTAFVAMEDRGHGFPRFKKFGQYRSFVFPQFRKNPVIDGQIKLPKLGLMPIVLHRPIPNGFVVKTARVVRKHSGWYATLCIQLDVSILDVLPHGHGIGIDVGLAYFLSTSHGLQIERPRFFGKLQSQLKSDIPPFQLAH